MTQPDAVKVMNSVVAERDEEETAPPRAVALRPATAPRLPLPTAAELAALKDYGEIVVRSGMAPKHVDTWQAAVVIMRYGHQLGIDEFTALNNVFLINQRPACMASLLHGLIQRDHGDDAVVPVQIGPERVVLRCKRRTSREVVEISYTIDEAKKAGLLEDPKKITWRLYPTDMLFSRAISRAGRMLFRDSTLGMYTPEEIGGTVIEVSGEVVDTALPLPSGSAQPSHTPAADRDAAAERPVDEKTAMRKAFFAALTSRGVVHADAQKALCTHIFPDVESRASYTASMWANATSWIEDEANAATISQYREQSWLARIEACHIEPALGKLAGKLGETGQATDPIRSAFRVRRDEIQAAARLGAAAT